MKLSDAGELGLLRELESRGLIVGTEHDAAELAGGLVVTQDALVEGVHFRLDWLSWRELGFRAAAVNISDLAASAAQPEALLRHARAARGRRASRTCVELYEGLAEAGVPVRGGDTTERGPGRRQRHRARPLRARPRPSGRRARATSSSSPARSARPERRSASGRYVRPPIRDDEGLRLGRRRDGDARRLRRDRRRRGPPRPPLRLPGRDRPRRRAARAATLDDLGFGEDFELLAAVPPRPCLGFPVIGRCEEGEGVAPPDAAASRTTCRGYEHFTASRAEPVRERALEVARAGGRRRPSPSARRPRTGSPSGARGRRSGQGTPRCSSMFSRTSATPRSAAIASSSGSIALHGLHQGPRSRRSSARRAASTSVSKVASVTSLTAVLRSAAQPQQRHLPDRLEHDRARHLRAADLAVDEADRHLPDAEALAQRAVGQLDLERVAARVHRVEVDRLEHGAPEALEAAGQVAHRHAEHEPRVERAAGRDRRAGRSAPVLDAAARDVARAEHEVGVLRRREQPRHVGRVVREVAVHLDDQLGARVERAAEAGEVGRARALPCAARCSTSTKPSSAASRSASSPVPSGELSSITSTRSSGPSTSPSARSIGSRFSRSL